MWRLEQVWAINKKLMEYVSQLVWTGMWRTWVECCCLKNISRPYSLENRWQPKHGLRHLLTFVSFPCHPGWAARFYRWYNVKLGPCPRHTRCNYYSTHFYMCISDPAEKYCGTGTAQCVKYVTSSLIPLYKGSPAIISYEVTLFTHGPNPSLPYIIGIGQV